MISVKKKGPLRWGSIYKGVIMLKEKLIVSPFNFVFWVLTAFFAFLLTVISFLAKEWNEGIKTAVFVTICLFNCVFFFLYKSALSRDPEYDRLRTSMGGFSWWGELPFHLCNINMILLPVAVMGNIQSLKSFCFFIGPLGAAVALLMPGSEFDNAYLFLPRIIGFYGTHFMIIIEALMLVTFGFYRPAYQDIPKAIAILVALCLAMHGLNLFLRRFGIYDRSNYFYTMETEENSFLAFFYSRIPHPFFYLLPLFLVAALYMCLVAWLYGLIV